MKRIIALLLALITIFGMLAGCGEEKEPSKEPTNNDDPIDIGDDGKEDEVRTYDTVVQQALAVVAEAYYDRRSYIQYEDNPLIKSGGILRADRHKYSPEDSTKQFTTYSNCAAFTYDVYKEALGIDIICWTTSSLQAAEDMHALTCSTTLTTSEEKEEWFQKVRDTIQPGDIINYRKDSWGHAMLYVGYNEVIHCSSNFGTGGSYNMSAKKEVLDPSGGIYKTTLEEVFAKHLDGANAFSLVRPTIKFTDAQPTEKTLNRIANLQGIYVEKTSSHAVGMTADQGVEVTFTFSLKNSNKVEKTLEITDVVPANTTYVSGADTVEGTNLKWSVTIPAGSKIDVSYTVKVNADAKDGDKVHSVAKVGGVDVQCRPIYIGGALTAEEQTKIYDAASKVSGSSASGLALAKQIYASAGIPCNIGTEAEIISSMFKTTTRATGHFELNTSSEYMKILAPTMYGGNLVYTDTKLYDGDRTKGPMLTQLMAGDIVICRENSTYAVYLFVGQNKVMDLNAGNVAILDLMGTRDALFTTIGYSQFVIIRPAMAE